MRAGKLKTRRYRVRRGGHWLPLVILAALLAGGAVYFSRGGSFSLPLSLPLSPAPTLTPRESAADTRTVTLSGQTWYALQLGAFDGEGPARELAQGFQARGAGGFLHRQDQYRVLAAAYPARADAQAVQAQLRSRHNVEAVVYEISWPQITLRLTGQKAQLTALEDAYAALEKAAEHLSALSLSLDRRETEAQAARSALLSEKETASALAQRLAALFGTAPHSAVQKIIALLTNLADALQEAVNAQGETRLGAQVKYCQLLCISGLAVYAQGLSP